MDNKLLLLYTDPSAISAFTNPARLYRAARNAGLKVTRKYVKKFLETNSLYTTHRGRRVRFKRSTLLATGLDYCWQSDLLHVKDFWRQNGGTRYLCIIVDCLSSFLWVILFLKKAC